MDLDEAMTFRGWKSHQDPKDVDEALEALAVEVERLRKIEAAAREVIAGEMPHECWHDELREALGEDEDAARAERERDQATILDALRAQGVPDDELQAAMDFLGLGQ